MKNHLRLLPKDPLPFAKVLVRLLLIPAVTILFFTHARAQVSKPDYSTDAAWIKMMDDPNVNYYEALKAYDEYWKHHKKPAGEEEEMAEGRKDFKEMERETKREIKKEKGKRPDEEELKTLNENDRMKYQVKRFEQWAREVKPFVQEDGRILSDQERMNIWKKQQEEIKKQQK